MNNFGFNIGACIFTALFFGGHKAYGLMVLSCILFCIPGVNLIWMIICGIKGANWAYNHAELSEEEFTGSLETWNRGGIIGLIYLLIVIIFVGISVAAGIGKDSSLDDQDTLKSFLNPPAIEMQLDELSFG